ncbi:hypothetical protein PNI0076_01512 [Streptococcus pneumoniae PNI0076]|nr:hypothetical protein PNI0010_01747 [Streptococcus pneumoniae PNI0010]ELU82840.1 hypothetical protein PNI0076_01512 [Streptococcus pneumoniae PNI0076]
MKFIKKLHKTILLTKQTSYASFFSSSLSKTNHFILFENQIQTTSTSPCRTQVQPAASFLVCSLIFIEY